MTRPPIFSLIALVALTACGKPNPDMAVSVSEVLRNIHNWDGSVVTVEGWLGNCEGYDCGIYPSLSEAQIVAGDQSDTKAWSNAMDSRLSIGFDERFDRKAAALQFKPVKLKGKVSDECRGWMVGCTDRATDLYPISIKLNTSTKER